MGGVSGLVGWDIDGRGSENESLVCGWLWRLGAELSYVGVVLACGRIKDGVLFSNSPGSGLGMVVGVALPHGRGQARRS